MSFSCVTVTCAVLSHDVPNQQNSQRNTAATMSVFLWPTSLILPISAVRYNTSHPAGCKWNPASMNKEAISPADMTGWTCEEKSSITLVNKWMDLAHCCMWCIHFSASTLQTKFLFRKQWFQFIQHKQGRISRYQKERGRKQHVVISPLYWYNSYGAEVKDFCRRKINVSHLCDCWSIKSPSHSSSLACGCQRLYLVFFSRHTVFPTC